MARRDIPKLTIETITNLYLYGELIKPTPLEMTNVELIRGPEKPPGELGYTQVYSDASIFMSTGAGRFANGYQSPLVSAFMSGSTPPEYVPGQRNVFFVDRMNALYSPKGGKGKREKGTKGKGDGSIKLLKAFQKINNQTWKGSGRSPEAALRLRSPAPSCPQPQRLTKKPPPSALTRVM